MWKESDGNAFASYNPFIAVYCPNCIKYAVQEDLFQKFDDAEHAYLLSGEMRHTQENMTTHLVSAESAKEIINKQLQLESENRSMAYLIWHYDQKESDRNGWREYIEYPAVAYCKDKEDLRNITEIAVERPPEDTYDFVNREIRTRLIADGKESNGTEGYAIRRTFVGSFTFKQKNQYIDFGKELEAKFRRISTRDAEFQAMSRDEKLAEIVNLIENLLRKDDKYLKLNYSEICEEF